MLKNYNKEQEDVFAAISSNHFQAITNQTMPSPVSERAWGVYPDSVKMGLACGNQLMAVFRNKEQARIFGEIMWNHYYKIEAVSSEHFL